MFKVRLNNLEELDTICWCLQECLTNDKFHPSKREHLRLLTERLRNIYEVGMDISREASN